MTKGKAKIEMSDILTKLEFNDINFCEAGSLLSKVLDKIYVDLCEDSCAEEPNCTSTC